MNCQPYCCEQLYVEPGVTSGDYLLGFLLGTRQAPYEKQRHSVTITLQEVSPRTIGVLIALFERAVGLYAALIGCEHFAANPGRMLNKVHDINALDANYKLI